MTGETWGVWNFRSSSACAVLLAIIFTGRWCWFTQTWYSFFMLSSIPSPPARTHCFHFSSLIHLAVTHCIILRYISIFDWILLWSVFLYLLHSLVNWPLSFEDLTLPWNDYSSIVSGLMSCPFLWVQERYMVPWTVCSVFIVNSVFICLYCADGWHHGCRHWKSVLLRIKNCQTFLC